MQAAGPGVKPTVLLLHGTPGCGWALDLGPPIQRAGFNVLLIHYRGSCGSEGAFSYSNCIEDAEAALRYLRNRKMARQWVVNRGQIFVVGHSAGGFVGAMAASRSRHVRGLAYLSGWDIGSEVKSYADFRAKEVVFEFEDEARPMKGTSGEALLNEVVSNRNRYSLASVGPRIANRPILMTYGDKDDVCPPNLHHEPLKRALEASRCKNLEVHHFTTGHMYKDHRELLSSAVVRWLNHVSSRKIQ